MKIDVIVPVYNVEKYLGECIESVLGQTYNEYCLILVDDGSTDSSGDDCDQYYSKYPEKIKVLHEKNGGSLHARLIGVQSADGDVLVFLDSDDCLHNNALDRISNCFSKFDCDMLLYDTGDCEKFDTIQIKHSLDSGRVYEGEFKKKIYEKLLRGDIPNSVWLKAVKTTCAQLPERFMNHRLLYGEDLLMSAGFITNCEKIVYTNESLYYYRNRPGSAIRVFDENRNNTVKVVHEEFEKYIKEWDLVDSYPIFNARKVKGWIVNLLILINNKSIIEKSNYKNLIASMARDPYFRDAYKNMDRSLLSKYYNIMATILYNEQYSSLQLFYNSVRIAKKVIIRRKNDR